MDHETARIGENRNSSRLFAGAFGADMGEEQRTKWAVLMAAATLFAQKGYSAASVREIVEAAGVTKPTLYYYFKNKEDLYVKLMDEALGAFSGLLNDSLGRSGGLRERLLELFCTINELLHEHVDMLRLINSMIYGPRGATPEYSLEAQHTLLERVMTDLLKAGVEEGELLEENIPETLLLLLGLLRSLQILLVVKPERKALTRHQICRVIDAIFDGARVPLRNKEEERT